MGFIPERLTEAREARDLTMTALADLVGRKPASISHYEKGRYEPPPAVVEKLADALNVRVGFFYAPISRKNRGPTFFRSMAAATKRARTRADRRIDWAWDVLNFVEQYVEISPADVPVRPRQEWQALTVEDIEVTATNLRRAWGLGDGPIPNLVWLAEKHGILVVRDSIGNRHLDAHSAWCDGRPIVVLNSDKKSAVRSRFDCAHEIGHMVLHGDVDRTHRRRTEAHKEIEKQADLFAAAFMMPAESFASETGHWSLEGLLHLKPRWKMSVAAMLMRSKRLGLTSRDETARLRRARSRRGWNKREPFDDTILPESPRMLVNAFEMIAEHGLASRDAVLAATELDANDIEALAGLGSGYLSSDGDSKVIPFRKLI